MEKQIEIDGQLINYSESGSANGDPVILLHGWGCNLSTLASVEKIFAEGMHVYNLDQPGFGKSPEPGEQWGVEEYTRIVEKFAEKLHIVKPALVGHSFGGRVSILMASRTPVSKVVLIDAAGVKPKRSMKYYFKVYSYKFVKKVLPYFVGRRNAEVVLNRYRKRVGSSDYNSSTPMMRSIMSKVVNEDLRYAMPQIAAPTLLIWGENDTATPMRDARIMEKLIPDAGLVSFPGCGHYSFLDNPFGFKAVINEFFKAQLK